jgi:predicted TIM-barrel fold metal-dependent hydrolase
MTAHLSILEENKIDCHCHILDPIAHPYPKDNPYHPKGQEVGDAQYFTQVMSCYGVKHALLVGPNSGYNLDNRAMLAAIKQHPGVFKGIAVVPNDCDDEHLQALQSQGVIGVAFNTSLKGVDFYKDIEPLLMRLRALGMWAQFQVENDQLPQIMPWIEKSQVKVLIDHCGRPNLHQDAGGVDQAGFKALLDLGQHHDAVIKLSGYAKFSLAPYPFLDTRPFIDALVHAFGLQRCVWASDWPYLKATSRLDYGPMIKLVESHFGIQEREQLFWSTPKKLFGF